MRIVWHTSETCGLAIAERAQEFVCGQTKKFRADVVVLGQQTRLSEGWTVRKQVSLIDNPRITDEEYTSGLAV